MEQQEDFKPIPPELLDCQPGPGWALIEPFDQSKTKGGVILPDAVRLSYLRGGRIEKMGPNRVDMQTEHVTGMSEGNTILYDGSKAPGIVLVRVNGQERHLVRHVSFICRAKFADERYVIPKAPLRLHAPTPEERGAINDLPTPVR